MPLLEHTSDTHPSRPSSSVTHSIKSTCMATGRNPFKPLKPPHAFKLHCAKIESTPLQLHGKLGIVALTRTNFNIRRASTRHRQCAAELPHSYIALAAAAKPHHACKIKFLEDYYPHVLVTYTRFSVASIFNTIQQLLPKSKTWTTWPTIWIAMGQETVTDFTTVRAQCAQLRTSWDTCVNHVSDKAKRPKYCLALNPHGRGGCCYIGKIEIFRWSVVSRTWNTDSLPARTRHGVGPWRQRRPKSR